MAAPFIPSLFLWNAKVAVESISLVPFDVSIGMLAISQCKVKYHGCRQGEAQHVNEHYLAIPSLLLWMAKATVELLMLVRACQHLVNAE